MILCDEKNKSEILEYIGDEYGKCLYLYIDLLKYGFDNEHVKLWYQKDNEEIKVILLNYYSGVHVYSRQEEFDEADLADLIKKINPSMICGLDTVIDKIRSYLPGYILETGIVAELTNYNDFNDDNSYPASLDEIEELAKLLATDEALGKPYGFELLFEQLKTRYEERFGRNYIYRIDGEIAATASTYAEIDKVAVISGVMVAPKYRGRGLSKLVLSSLCKALKDEGKRVYSFYYIEQAMKMHKAVGFTEIGKWSKLVQL